MVSATSQQQVSTAVGNEEEFSSLNGVLTATSITTGQVLDCAIFSKYCTCKQRFEREHSDTCIANYAGTSGGTEVAGVRDIFMRSQENYRISFKYYLGDGDSKGFGVIDSEKPYGNDLEVQKLECVGHVKKRMGSRLRAFRQKTPSLNCLMEKLLVAKVG